MLSLTGVPPIGGFSGKFFLFRAAVEADLVWLALVGVVTSVISAYFYLRLVYLSYMFEGEEGAIASPRALDLVVGVSALATLVLGLLPGPWFDAAQQAILNGGRILAGG